MKKATQYRYRMLKAAHKEYQTICEEIGLKPMSQRIWLKRFDIMDGATEYAYYYQGHKLPVEHIAEHLNIEATCPATETDEERMSRWAGGMLE